MINNIKKQFIYINETLNNDIDEEVEKFRKKIFDKYKIKLYIAIPKTKVNLKPIISLYNFWNLAIEIISEDHPHLLNYADFTVKNRTREWMLYVHSFAFLSKAELSFGPTEISKFMDKTHASIINSITKAEHAIWANDNTFLEVHNKLIIKLTEYVGTISKNTKV